MPETYLSFPVAIGSLEVDGSDCYALPTASLLSLTRWKQSQKYNWEYRLKYTILNNITALVSISYLSIAIWLMFVGDMRVWYYLTFITLSYIFYFGFERISPEDGIVYDQFGRKAGLVNLLIKKDDLTQLSIWTNHEGKFKFGYLPDGQYQIFVNDAFEILDPVNGYYRGQKFTIDRNNICMLPIVIRLKRSHQIK
jgi:hypothetical protein